MVEKEICQNSSLSKMESQSNSLENQNEMEQESSSSTESQQDTSRYLSTIGRVEGALSVDEMTLLKAYPQLREMPPEHVPVVVLAAVGMTTNTIARTLKLSRATVCRILGNYDIAKVIRDSLDLQKLLLANSLGSIVIEAVSAAREKIETIRGLPIREIIYMIRELHGIYEKIQPKMIKGSDTDEELLKKL